MCHEVHFLKQMQDSFVFRVYLFCKQLSGKGIKRSGGLNMKIKEMPKLVIGELVAKLPIIQGGMGIGVSLSSLASAG
jgi:hypothetical protein